MKYPLLAALVGFAAAAHAATVVPVTGITGHDGGNWPSYFGHLTDMVNALNPTLISTGDTPTPGMSNTSDPDPANWTWSGSYQQTWHANSILDSGTSGNGKIGWVIMDFGSVVSNLENMYMWASSTGQTGSGTEQVRNFNIYYSSGVGINTLPAMPQSKGTTGDYDFTVGDWTQIGSTQDLGTASGAVNVVQPLGGVSARYVAVEVMTIGGVDNRMAIAQIEFTTVPEPAVALFGGLGLLALLRRRR
jgi:hypothetical protein